MFSFKLTLNTGIVANLLGVCRGDQTGAGITIAPAVQAGLNGAWPAYSIQNDLNSPGNIRVGGVNISSGGTDGILLLPGESYLPGAARPRHAIGNVAIVAVANGAIINIDLLD